MTDLLERKWLFIFFLPCEGETHCYSIFSGEVIIPNCDIEYKNVPEMDLLRVIMCTYSHSESRKFEEFSI